MSCARLFLGIRSPNADFCNIANLHKCGISPITFLFYFMETPASAHQPELNNLRDRAERAS